MIYYVVMWLINLCFALEYYYLSGVIPRSVEFPIASEAASQSASPDVI